ncbi:hypothetical protein B1R94_02360 [Mycolicibacterium litorale]|nr:hypothetical protein B1R94_02360 [Mycolicibacterium litorale]
MPVLPDKQMVSLRTWRGVQLYQFLPDYGQLIDLSWSLESRDVSTCRLTIPTPLAVDGGLPQIQPWLHWIDVWDGEGQKLLWSGPIQRAALGWQTTVITAKDIGALYTRTRCPITKRWDATDPAAIAHELVNAMIGLHNVNVAPIVRFDPFGDKFDYAVTADAAMLDTHISELVNLGLFWTVVGGVPMLGPRSRKPVAALSETDFMNSDGITLDRDGSSTFNDVLLLSGTDKSRSRVEMGGLNLQTIFHSDTTTGVSNTDRATKASARYVSRFHDTISLPDNAVLHPSAPVSIDELLPSARMTIEAFGMLIPVELTGIDVSYTPDTSAVSIRIAAVDDELPELITLQRKNSISGLGQGVGS